MESRTAWRSAAHPVFLDQMRKLSAGRQPDTKQAQRAREQVLAMLRDLCLHIIPADPMRHDFDLCAGERPFGGHWRRAYFGGKRFILMFRVDPAARVIIFGCVADLAASRLTADDARPAVLLGCVCPINAAGDISLPEAIRNKLAVRAGSRIVLRAGRFEDAIQVSAAQPDGQDFSRLALRLWLPSPAPERIAPAASGQKPARRRTPAFVPAHRVKAVHRAAPDSNAAGRS